MSKTRFRGPRHVSISRDPIVAADQNSENARDTLDALSRRLRQRYVRVEQYTAVGSTSAKVPLGASERPVAVQLVYAAAAADSNAPLGVTGNANFSWDSASQSINAFEPTGLTANAIYTLVFVVMEA